MWPDGVSNPGPLTVRCPIDCALRPGCVSTVLICFNVNGYNFKGNNSGSLSFCFLFSKGINSKGKDLLFDSRSYLKGFCRPEKHTGSSHKLSPCKQDLSAYRIAHLTAP